MRGAKSSALLLLYCLVCLAGFVEKTDAALKCYQCITISTLLRDPCHDPASFQDIEAETCSDGIWSTFIDLLKGAVISEKLKLVCRKTRFKIGNVTMLRRDCASVPQSMLHEIEDNQCKQLSRDTNGVVSYCGICEQDGCNLASSLHVTSVTSLFSLALLLSMTWS